jgi:hypothetical protein
MWCNEKDNNKSNNKKILNTIPWSISLCICI